MTVDRNRIIITDLYAYMSRETFDTIPEKPRSDTGTVSGDCWKVFVPKSDKWFLLWVEKSGRPICRDIIVKDV